MARGHNFLSAKVSTACVLGRFLCSWMVLVFVGLPPELVSRRTIVASHHIHCW